MRRSEVCSRHSQSRTKRVVLAGEDDDALGRGHRLKDRDQVLRCARCAGGKFKVAIASMERAHRTKRILGHPGENFGDTYPKRRDGQPAPKQYVRNAPAGKADRHQEGFRRGPNPTVSADSLGEFSLEKTSLPPRTKKLYVMMA